MNTKKDLTELKQIIAKAQAEIERIESEPTRTTGRARTVEGVNWYVNSTGGVCIANNCPDEDKQKFINNNNAFIDFESAEREAKRNNLIVQLREVCDQHEPCDWDDLNQRKYYIVWGYSEYEWYTDYFETDRVSTLPHCTNCDALEAFCKSLPLEDVKLLIEGVQ